MATASGDQEGFGLVTVEAIGCGCPVIVSDLPVVDDVVADPSRRFRSGDTMDLADKIIQLFDTSPSNRKLVDENLRNFANRRFNWVHVAAGYAESLNEVAH